MGGRTHRYIRAIRQDPEIPVTRHDVFPDNPVGKLVIQPGGTVECQFWRERITCVKPGLQVNLLSGGVKIRSQPGCNGEQVVHKHDLVLEIQSCHICPDIFVQYGKRVILQVGIIYFVVGPKGPEFKYIPVIEDVLPVILQTEVNQVVLLQNTTF